MVAGSCLHIPKTTRGAPFQAFSASCAEKDCRIRVHWFVDPDTAKIPYVVVYHTPVGAEEREDPEIPAGVTLAIHGNPGQLPAHVTLVLSRSGSVRVRIFDASGRAVKTLAEGLTPRGRHDLVWQGDSDAGQKAAAGVYWVQADIGGRRSARQLVVLR